MDKLKVLLLISILNYSVVSSLCSNRFNYLKPWNNGFKNNDNKNKDDANDNPCPGDQSHISANDIKDLIDHIMEQLQVEENLVNSYFEKAVGSNKKHLSDLNDYQERVVNRPKHIKHILEDMAKKRQSIEPIVNDIAAKAMDIDAQNEKYQEMLSRSKHLLGVFSSIKTICDKNCDDPNIYIELDFEEKYNGVLVAYPTTYACWKLSELQDLIKDKLEDFVYNFKEELSTAIDQDNETYKDLVQSSKNHLKNATLKQYGSIMYEILSLQDDVYHFEEDINEIQIGKQLEEIKTNNLDIEHHLHMFETNIEKYRIHCLSCPVKFNFLKYEYTPIYYNDERDLDMKHINDFIDHKIEDIKTIINQNLTEIFEELDDRLNNQNLDDMQANIVESVEDIAAYVEIEREAFNTLKNAVPQESINEISKILQDSNELLKVLKNIKEFFDYVLHSRQY